MRSFKNGFKRARKEAGYTQKTFSEAFRVSIDTVKNWEQGRSVPEVCTIEQLCDFFKCDMDYLFNQIKCRTHDAQFICEYTGLSQEAVMLLHYLSRNDAPKVHSDIPYINRRNIQFINRELQTAYLSMKSVIDECNTAHLLPIDTVFSLMEKYATASSAKRLLSLEELQMRKNEIGSFEGYQQYDARISLEKSCITIDGEILETFAVGELYREYLFNLIRKRLDLYSDTEQQ